MDKSKLSNNPRLLLDAIKSIDEMIALLERQIELYRKLRKGLQQHLDKIR
jgi:prefoldin subunit 5